jgi:PadR family transcriptional regulator PadR
MGRGEGRRGSAGAGSGGRGVARYVEACLLLLLAERSGHGHELNLRLAEVFPLPGLVPDVSTVYRALADLEGQGAVRGRWGPGDGAGRKVYELTSVGWDLLDFWEQRFQAEREGLAGFLERHHRLHERPRALDNCGD